MRIIFAGTPAFAAQALDALIQHKHQIVAVYTQPDRPAGRGMQLTASPVKQLALEHRLPVYQPASLKHEHAQLQLAELQADLMIVAAYGLILPQAILDTPRLGCINIHASILPRWRGAAPIQRAILAGDQQTGITIMQMDSGLDTGDMLLINRCAITPEDSSVTLHDKLAALGASSIVQALTELSELKPQPQDEALACYASKISKQEAMLDWQLPAIQLERAIRAYNPFPISKTEFQGKTIKVWQAQLANTPSEATPGQIIEVDKHGITVACGQGNLTLTQLQRPGGKAQPASQLLQALALNVGDHFN